MTIALSTSPKTRRHQRHLVGGLPLIHHLADRLGLKDILNRHVASHGNDQVPVVDVLMLLIYNLTLGKQPLYELPEWVNSIEPRAIGHHAFEPDKFNDDRFGRALDRLYQADRASLMTDAFLSSSVAKY